MKSILTFALVAVAATGYAETQMQFTVIPESEDINTRSHTDSCFDYSGTFKDGSPVIAIDWDKNGSSDECFGITPNRTIWHAWPGSGGWREMPNNGRADKILGGNIVSGHREISVWVTSTKIVWCSSLSSTLVWSPWFRCGSL